MLEHVNNPHLVISEIKRVLKDEGIVIITVPFLVPEHADPYDFQRYTPHGLAFLLENKGFKVLEKIKYGGKYTVMVEFLKFNSFNPYSSSSLRIKLGNKILPKLLKIANYFDKRSNSPIIYAGTLVIAKKTKEIS